MLQTVAPNEVIRLYGSHMATERRTTSVTRFIYRDVVRHGEPDSASILTSMSQDAWRQGSCTDGCTSLRPLSPPGEFSTLCVDDDPTLLAETYRLRFHVYCFERAFLRAADYPDGLETDQFDRYAKHLATVDSAGRVVGTVRLVFPSILGQPLFRHCSVFPDETELYDPRHSVVEISRLSVSRQHRPRRHGNHERGWTTRLDNVLARKDPVVFSLCREAYQVSKRAGLTHWVVATEASLQRTLAHYGFPFRLIGPEIDYFGPVAPYLMDLSVFDRVILSPTMPKLEGLLDGLEDHYKPRPSGRRPDARPGSVRKRSDVE